MAEISLGCYNENPLYTIYICIYIYVSGSLLSPLLGSLRVQHIFNEIPPYLLVIQLSSGILHVHVYS